MGADEVLTQLQAWSIYDEWLSDERVLYLDEPPGLETSFRDLTQLRHAAPKDWADSHEGFAGLIVTVTASGGFTLVSHPSDFRHSRIREEQN